jgi:hypothetical protein
MTVEVLPKYEVHCTAIVLDRPKLVEVNVKVPYYTSFGGKY